MSHENPESEQFTHETCEGFGGLSEATLQALDDMEANPDKYADLAFPAAGSEVTAERVIRALHELSDQIQATE